MGMSNGGMGGAVSEINVTPLIDVLLVLLIIFMVIVPVAPKGLDALVPQAAKADVVERITPQPVVVQVSLSVSGEPSYSINDMALSKGLIESRLVDIFSARQEKVMFVKAGKDLEFRSVAEVIDFGHQAGVENIGLITPRVEAGR